MAEGHLNKITAEASKVNESIQLHGKTECRTTTYHTLLCVWKICNMKHCSHKGSIHWMYWQVTPKVWNRPINYMQGYNKWIALRFILHKANFVLLLLTSQILFFYIFINLLLNWTASNLTHLWEPPRIIGSQIVISMRVPGDHGLIKPTSD